MARTVCRTWPLADAEISESWGFPGAQWSAPLSLHLNTQSGWEELELEVGYLRGSLCPAGSAAGPWARLVPWPLAALGSSGGDI